MYNSRLQKAEKKTKKKFPLWAKISLWTLASFLFLVTLLSVLAFVFEEKIADQIVKYTYTQFDTKIEHKSFKFSLLKHFPRGTATLNGVTVLEKTDSVKKSNLLTAEKIDLQFNFWNVFSETISIEKIEIQKATLNLKYFSDGKNNFSIFHPKTEDTSSTDFSLKNIVLKEVQVNYDDLSSQQKYHLLAKNAKASGNFKKERFLMKLKGDFYVQAIQFEEINYFKEKNVSLDVALQIDQAKKEFSIQKGNLKLDYLTFDVSGKMAKKEELYHYNIDILGENLEIKSLIDEAPEAYKEWFTPYKPTGFANLKLTISRDGETGRSTRITGNATIKDASITRISSGISLSKLNTALTFTNGKRASSEDCILNIPQFTFNIENSTFSGSFSMSDFTKPVFAIKANADFDLALIKKFFLDDKMDYLTGAAKTDLTLSFQAKNMKITPIDLLKAKSSGTLEIKQVTAKSKSNNLQFSKGNGSFEYKDNGLIIKKLTGVVNNSDFDIQGKFQNIFNWLFFDNEAVEAEASLHSNHFDLGNILAGISSQTPAKKQSAQVPLKLSPKLNYAVRISASNFVFNDFSATEAVINMNMKNQRAMIQSMRFNSCGGVITASAEVDGATHPDKFLVSCNASVKNADIVKLMKSFNNFGQKEITYDNIEGKITVSTWFSLLFSNTLQPDKSSVKATAEIALDNGRLKNYKTLENLANFMDVAKLKDITFQKITNELNVLNSVVTIPHMEIENSVCNFTVSGKHEFSGKIDYHVSLLISDYIKARSGNNKPPASAEFGFVEDDGLNQGKIWILATGTTEKPEFKWDKAKAKEKRKNDLKNISTDIKSLIKNEMKDDAKITAPKNPQEIIFDDGELEKTKKTEATSPAKKTEPAKKTVVNPHEIIFEDN